MIAHFVGFLPWNWQSLAWTHQLARDSQMRAAELETIASHFQDVTSMKVSRFLAAAIASAALLCSVIAHATPIVVYGNLGASGTDPLGTTVTAYGPSEAGYQSLAQGFTTGTSPDYLTLKSVTLGLVSTGSTSLRTVGLYSNSLGQPGSLLATSSAQNVTTNPAGAKYTFAFSDFQLSPGASYWIVPEAPGRWVREFFESEPGAQNSSGWSYLAAKRYTGASWVNGPSGVSISIQAVPEPSTFAMAGIGLSMAGLICWRRRQSGR